MTMLHPLATIRRQGLDADLHQGRIRVWPRHKINKALALFVTAHLEEIAQELTVEYNEKHINNVLLWNTPRNRGESGLPPEAIPKHLNGRRVAGVPASSL